MAALHLRSLAAYLPSLLSRYSTQVLVIAIPWLLQGRGLDAAAISSALLPFYAGAFLLSAWASAKAPRWHLARTLVAALLLQGLFALLCLQSESVGWLAVFRFLQGAATGLSRPLAQLWALECEASVQDSAERKMQVHVFVQVAIALGMSLGSWVGVALAQAHGSVLPVVLAVGLPVALACASVATLARRAARLEAQVPQAVHGPAASEDASEEREAAATPWTQRPVQAVFLVFFASMAAYNVWPILVPFALRASSPAPELLAALAMALTLQPVLFGISQLVIAAWLKRRPAGDSILLLGLVVGHGLSLLAFRLAAQETRTGAFVLLFLLGGGLLVAVIYPVSSLLLMRAVAHLPVALRVPSQRRLVVQFGLAGDLGQLAGGGLIAANLMPQRPIDLFLALGVLALPALAALWPRPSRPMAG